MLTESLEVYQLDPNKPFYIRTDASRYAIGAVLEQIQGGQRVPVAFFSWKLAVAQINCSLRQQETYLIVTALGKCSGGISNSLGWC